MRRTIGEVHVHMMHVCARKEICEVECIARSQFCLCPGPIFVVVLLDQITRPFAGGFRVALENLQNLLRRRVMNWRA